MRSARRLAAGLAVVAAVVPLAGLPTVSPAWAAPVRAATSTLEGECDPDNPKLVNQKPAALLQLGAAEAQTVATGAGITVAVVDSGVDSRNIHLTGGAVAPGVDYVTPGGNGETDTYGHGTAVAGLIAARAVQGSGVVGLAPNVTILPIRVYSQDGDNAQQPGERPPSVAGIAVGIQAAANLGARIINVSLSTTDNDPGLESAVRYATDRGALVVASAGNRTTSEDKSNSPRYPGAYGDVLSVAAVDGTGNVTDDSIHGSYVDVAAPGTDVLTTYLNAGDCQLATDNASTSYATAFVSAAAAMIAQAHPTETPAQWRFRLESTALRLRPDARDDNAGWGVIQPYEALTLVSDGTAPGPQDPAVTDPPSATPVAADLPLGSVQEPDHTTRDQTLWLGLGGVVAVLGLALVALLRRDRRREPAATRPPAGVR